MEKGQETHVLDAGLHEPPCLETHPNHQHGKVARLDHALSTLGSELP
jgi:hypothetical protein